MQQLCCMPRSPPPEESIINNKGQDHKKYEMSAHLQIFNVSFAGGSREVQKIRWEFRVPCLRICHTLIVGNLTFRTCKQQRRNGFLPYSSFSVWREGGNIQTVKMVRFEGAFNHDVTEEKKYRCLSEFVKSQEHGGKVM